MPWPLHFHRYIFTLHLNGLAYKRELVNFWIYGCLAKNLKYNKRPRAYPTKLFGVNFLTLLCKLGHFIIAQKIFTLYLNGLAYKQE